MKISIDTERSTVAVETAGETKTFPMQSAEAFSAVSRAWLRAGWDTKYVYSFSWMGRPIIQLPEDMIRTQEVLYQIKPDVIIETGIAHGGSLIFYAGLCKLIGRGRVIGVDIDIRKHNRMAIEEHSCFPLITMFEGSSISPEILDQIRNEISPTDRVFVILDSNHSRAHVLAELESYSKLVSIGSYIVATDGIMQDLVGAPRSEPDWEVNNPQSAAREFVDKNRNFILVEPVMPFNEGMIKERVTYWPAAWIKRIS